MKFFAICTESLSIQFLLYLTEVEHYWQFIATNNVNAEGSRKNGIMLPSCKQ